MTYYVYILSNQYHTVLYVGVTNNLTRRVIEHKEKLTPGFSSKYNVNKLVFYEDCGQIDAAIQREKQLKHWTRTKKLDLILAFNPELKDFYEDIEL